MYLSHVALWSNPTCAFLNKSAAWSQKKAEKKNEKRGVTAHFSTVPK